VAVQKHSLFRLWLVVWSYIQCFFGGRKPLQKKGYLQKGLSPILKAHSEGLNKLLKKMNLVQHTKLPNQIEMARPVFPSNPYVCIFPGASSFTKSWPKESFSKLIDFILKETTLKVVLCGGNTEVSIGSYLCFGRNPNRLENKVGQLDLKETLQLLAGSAGFVSNDSFPGHAAKEFGKPGVVIFGPTSPAFGFAPDSTKVATLWSGIGCSPCSRHGKADCRFRDLACLTSILPEEVFDVLRLQMGLL
jgi:heptosyltransferase II